MAATARPARPRAGHLVIIGGAEDKLRQRTILARFVTLAGGPAARILVISTASSLGDEATDLYRSLFEQLGAAEVRSARPMTREEANATRLADSVREVTGVFLTGGNQLRLSSTIGQDTNQSD